MDEFFAGTKEAVDDSTDELAGDGTVVVATVVIVIVVWKTLRVVHAEEPQKLNVNARRWLLRMSRKCRRYKSRGGRS